MISSPIFSIVERDRRWEAVRRIMAKPTWNLNAILTLGNGDKAYTRYLTQIGGRGGSADVIFPRESSQPVYAFLAGSRNQSFWEERLSSWLSDRQLVLSEAAGSKQVIDRLKALGLNKPGARIGIAKLTGSRFNPEGLVPSTYLEHLKGALPEVLFLPIEKWGPDPGPIDGPAMVKSPEEQEVIRQSVAVGEKAIETIVRTAPQAKRQSDIWLSAFRTMFEETGEDPTRLSISFDRGGNSTLGGPVADPAGKGQIIAEEIDATVQGYRGQVNHSIFIGGEKTPGFTYYKAAMEVLVKVFFDTLKTIVPGKTTCGEFVDQYAANVGKVGVEDRSGVVLHSSGIGNLSRPRLGPSNSRGDEGIVLVPGMAFDFKPALRMKRSVLEDVKKENRAVQIGEHVLVTEGGTVRLGKRELKPITTEGE